MYSVSSLDLLAFLGLLLHLSEARKKGLVGPTIEDPRNLFWQVHEDVRWQKQTQKPVEWSFPNPKHSLSGTDRRRDGTSFQLFAVTVGSFSPKKSRSTTDQFQPYPDGD
jgi:hypothetical protein